MNIIQEKRDSFNSRLLRMTVKIYAATHLNNTFYTTHVRFFLQSASIKPHEIKKFQSGVITMLLNKVNLPPT